MSIKLSGVVVTFNDARHLPDCLAALRFCDDLLVVDLGSTDGCPAIAAELGARVLRHERVPIVEQVRLASLAHLAHDWIVIADPDEVFPADVGARLRRLIASDLDLGAIALPTQYHFRGKRLDCTFWGEVKTKAVVFHRDRVTLTSDVHRGLRLKDGYHATLLTKEASSDHITHYWVDSYAEMFEKHWRYVKHEGASQHHAGRRFSYSDMAHDVASTLRRNLLDLHGLRGGVDGLFLSLFHTGYTALSWLSLRHYERGRNRSSILSLIRRPRGPFSTKGP